MDSRPKYFEIKEEQYNLNTFFPFKGGLSTVYTTLGLKKNFCGKVKGQNSLNIISSD